MICALWGVDLKFPPVTRASPLVPRLSRLAPLLSRLASRASPLAFPLPLLISAHLLISARFARFAHPPSRVPRAAASFSPKNRQRKTVFHDNRSGCVGHCKNHFFSLQPLSWRHCKNHFLSIVSQTPLDACLAPWYAMLGGCGPPPPGEALRRSSPPLVTCPASTASGSPSPRAAPRFRHDWHPDTLTL